ncbi:hypothetical protein LEMLEM_LOCUS10152, partial [Lemmus lemmus]
ITSISLAGCKAELQVSEEKPLCSSGCAQDDGCKDYSIFMETEVCFLLPMPTLLHDPVPCCSLTWAFCPHFLVLPHCRACDLMIHKGKLTIHDISRKLCPLRMHQSQQMGQRCGRCNYLS